MAFWGKQPSIEIQCIPEPPMSMCIPWRFIKRHSSPLAQQGNAATDEPARNLNWCGSTLISPTEAKPTGLVAVLFVCVSVSVWFWYKRGLETSLYYFWVNAMGARARKLLVLATGYPTATSLHCDWSIGRSPRKNFRISNHHAGLQLLVTQFPEPIISEL